MRRADTRRILYVAIVATVVAASHLAALVQLDSQEFDYNPYYLWKTQYTVLVVLSLLVSLGTGAARSVALLLSGLMGRLLLLVLLGLPLGKDVGVEQALLMPLLFTAGLAFAFPLNAALSAACLGVVILSQQPAEIMRVAVPAPGPAEILRLLWSGALVASLTCSLRALHDRYLRQRESLQKLERAVHKLTDTNLGYQDLAVALEERSRLAERQRISRDIHDVVGYTMTNILMLVKTGLLMASGVDPELRRLLANVRTLTQNGMSDIRRTLYQLQAREASRSGGLRAIHTLARNFHKSTGIEVAIEYGNISDTLGPQLDFFVYRMIQEGLTNAFKHSEADKIRIMFWQSEQEVRISVLNNNNRAAFRELHLGIGLSGMQERLKSLGGDLTIASTRDGFELMASIPHREPA